MANGLRVVDIDVDDEAVVAAIMYYCIEILGAPAAVRYRENAPRLLIPYRAAADAPPKRAIEGSGGKIEVLGRGQQFVAHGLHTSGVPYLWTGGEFPDCLPRRDELPAVTEEQIATFFAAVAPMIDSHCEKSAVSAAQHSPNPTAQAPIADIEAALSVIPNPDLHFKAWKDIGLATWAASGGSEEGREAFRSWSAESRKHDDDEFEVQWDGIARSPPDRIGFGTLVFHAREAVPGWRPPSRGTTLESAQGRFEAVALPADSSESDSVVQASAPGLPGFQAPPPQQASAPTRVFRVIEARTLEGAAIPERQWLVPGWIPFGKVTALYGNGGTGKTLLAQQLMTACATGTLFCGLTVMRCKSLALFCEDDEGELHRRQADINAALGVNFSDLADMRWASGVGEDNALATFGLDGSVNTMATYDALRKAVAEYRPRLVVLDTAADMFAGNENDRGQVRRFLSLLARVASEFGLAILLNAHPSRAGGKGDMDGGSTAWSNSVRSRLSLSLPDDGNGGTTDPNERILKVRKSNYSATGESIRLRWVEWALLPIVGEASDGIDKAARAEAVFLRLLRQSAARGSNLSLSKNASNYAPRELSRYPDAEGFKVNDFERAMMRLLASNRIVSENYGKRSEGRQRIRCAGPSTEAAAPEA